MGFGVGHQMKNGLRRGGASKKIKGISLAGRVKSLPRLPSGGCSGSQIQLLGGSHALRFLIPTQNQSNT